MTGDGAGVGIGLSQVDLDRLAEAVVARLHDPAGPPAPEGRPGPGLTMMEAIDLYVGGRRDRGEFTAKSARNYFYRLRKLARSAGVDLPVAELDRGRLLDYLRSIGDQKPASRRAHLSAVKGFCAWAVDEGHLGSDPTLRVAKIKEPRRVPRALTAEQVGQLLAACRDPRETFVIRLMLALGLRRIEVAQLEMSDIDLDRRILTVRGKGSHERVLPLVPDVLDALDVWLAYRGRQPGPLVTNWKGTHAGGEASAVWVGLLVNNVFRRAGFKTGPKDGLSAHALRHTAASDVLDKCHDVRTVQAMLGHSSLATTQIYLRRASLDTLRDAMGGRSYGARPADTDPAGGV